MSNNSQDRIYKTLKAKLLRRLPKVVEIALYDVLEFGYLILRKLPFWSTGLKDFARRFV